MRTAPLRLILVTGITIYIAMRMSGWLSNESEPQSARVGSATVSGVVVDDSGAPLAGAQVFITNEANQLPWTASTDATGKFRIEKLPAGQYQLGAAKEGYLSAYFADAPPPWGVTKVMVAAQSNLAALEVRLPRSASVEGTLVDADGRPLAGHDVRIRAVGRLTGSVIVSGSVGTARTDANGRYRLEQLDAGEYTLVARFTSPKPAGAQPDNIQSVFYFPAAAKLSDARTFKLACGERRTGVDIRASRQPFTRIEGHVIHAGAAPPLRLDVLLFDADATLPFGEDRTTDTDASGRFAFDGVPPGRFVVVAQTALRPPGSPATRDPIHITRLSSAVAVESKGGRIGPIALTLAPGVPVSGRLIHPHRLVPPNDDEEPITVRLFGVDPVSRARLGFGGPEARVASDGTFTLLYVPPGRFQFVVTDRVVERVAVEGRDLTGASVDVQDREIRNVTVAVSERAAVLSGSVRDGSGANTAKAVVVLFPIDPQLWKPTQFFVRVVRPDTSGRYFFEGLPAGDYCVIASTDLPFGSWEDPAVLEQLKPLASRARLVEGGKQTLELPALQTFNKTAGR